jgi:hypothetical protein
LIVERQGNASQRETKDTKIDATHSCFTFGFFFISVASLSIMHPPSLIYLIFFYFPDEKAGFVFREDVAPGLILEMSLNKIYHNTESEFQQIGVIDTYFGKTLVTDGKTQSAQFDEFAYHESLVHPALLNFAHYNKRGAKTVFIGGGGELATAREILRHTSVERVVMVDLDGK